ncbi:ribosomal RNA processing protein 36 homolog [Lates japonicus]|uniref:rRNA biogenesis protein RRP36 n=1 Tax=Lates japonicus TaxID=270547 RepID=A0AAD3NMT1_LATJO|nr:ribosomal RNA processing protein 36 homolog [Lates japonicus]
MKVKEKQRREVEVSKRTRTTSSSDDDDDSDVERNFALLTERGGRGRAEEGERYQGGEEEEEEEEEGSDGEGEEEEDESDDGDEEEEAEGEDEDDGDSEASEEEEDDGDEESEVAGGSSVLQTRDDIKKELSNMSFEDIMKLQNKVGTKVYNEVAYGSGKKRETGKKKRLNKNRPMEISAKKPAPFLRQVVPIKKPTLRDPRFDDLSGEYKPEIFDKTYKFINDIKQREKEIIQKQLKRTKKSNQRKEKLQFLLKRMDNQERARKSREQQRERELQFKRQQRERANQGAQPFFIKKSEKKKLQLAEKYQELKKSGKLENFLSKKRKRNAGKDRRKLPQQQH